jgi:hypothetical protein
LRDRGGHAIDFVAAKVDTFGLVDHAIVGGDVVDGRAPACGAVVFTEDVAQSPDQQGRNAGGRSLSHRED